MYTKKSTDAELIEGLKHNDSIATGILMHRYRRLIYSVSLKFFYSYEYCEDIESEIWIKVILKLREEKYSDQNIFSGWLSMLVKNYCIDLKRKDNRQRKSLRISNTLNAESEINITDIVPSNDPLPDENIDKELLSKNILSLISKLPKELQEVVYMRVFEEMQFGEIAEFQEISINTALGRMRYALENLRKIITSGQFV